MKIDIRILIRLALLLAGVLAVIYGGFSYTTDTHSADLGPIELSVEEEEHVNIPLWAGIGAIAVGGLTLALRRRGR
jgi:hypothetical protein